MTAAARSDSETSSIASSSSAASAEYASGRSARSSDRRGREAQVQPRHEVRVGVVIDHGRVLVGTGDTMDVELALVRIEPEVCPQARCLDQHLRPRLDQEVDVAMSLDVAPDRVGDVGVDVVLRGAMRGCV
jgi:hypothetical protein